MKEIFDRYSFFTEELIEELKPLFKLEKYDKNETLLTQGDIWDKIFIVKKGLIRLYFVTLEGQDYNKNFFCDSSIIWPLTSFLQKNESLFFIDTLENSEIYSANFNSFKEVLDKYSLWEKFSIPAYEALLNDKITREYSFLVNSAKDRYLEFLEKNENIIDRIPDYHLASYLGITSVSLSRIKKQININKC